MKITGNKLYQRVASAIADQIDAGRYVPGGRLPGERDLAEEFKVSRPTIREAMIALEMRGWIEARHGSGLYVTRAGHADAGGADALNLDVGAFDLIEARILFEGEAAALAAVSISDEQLVELEALLAVMADDRDEAAVYDADRQFHIGIAAATSNEAIRMVVELLWDVRTRSPLCVNMFARAESKGVRTQVGEHRRILDALRAGDPHDARNAMRAHLRGVVEDLLRTTELEALERARNEVEARRANVARRLRIGLA